MSTNLLTQVVNATEHVGTSLDKQTHVLELLRLELVNRPQPATIQRTTLTVGPVVIPALSDHTFELQGAEVDAGLVVEMVSARFIERGFFVTSMVLGGNEHIETAAGGGVPLELFDKQNEFRNMGRLRRTDRIVVRNTTAEQRTLNRIVLHVRFETDAERAEYWQTRCAQLEQQFVKDRLADIARDDSSNGAREIPFGRD